MSDYKVCRLSSKFLHAGGFPNLIFIIFLYTLNLYFSKVILQGKFRHFSLYSDPSLVVFILQDLQ